MTDIDDMIKSTITEINESPVDLNTIPADAVVEVEINGEKVSLEPPVTEQPETTPIPAPAEPVAAPVAEQVRQADSVLDKLFARITGPEQVTYRKVFLYGPPGCGKTVFSATAPNPLIVRIEPTGTLSLLNHPDLVKKAKTFEFLSVAQLEVLIETIIADPDAFQKKCMEVYGHNIDTFVVDSMSELQRIDLDTIIAREAAKDSDRNKYMRTWPDYNENTIHMAQLAGRLCKLPMHVIATCHRKEKEDKNKGITVTQPSLTDVLAEACAGFFDVFAYMSVSDDGARSLQVAPTRTVVAKTRVGNLPAVLAEPTWDKLFGHLPTSD